MPEVLRALEKVPSKFSMEDEGGPLAKDSMPPLRRLVRFTLEAGRGRLRLPAPAPRTQTNAAAW